MRQAFSDEPTRERNHASPIGQPLGLFKEISTKFIAAIKGRRASVIRRNE
jgi:hypothetical protein